MEIPYEPYDDGLEAAERRLKSWREKNKDKIESIPGRKPSKIQSDMVKLESGSWADGLYRNRFGGIIPSMGNVETILLNSEAWAGVLGYDEFSLRIIKRKCPPWAGGKEGEWTDSDETRLCIWLERHFFIRPSIDSVCRSVKTVAEINKYHPVREYLSGLTWDGKPRLATWTSVYLNAADVPYHRLVGKAWMIGAVARIFQPGCQMDHVLILEGNQGTGKSSAISILASPWYVDTSLNLSSSDFYLVMRGRWVIELGELDSLTKSEVSQAKQFFTVRDDCYRVPYGRNIVTVPRQCVFAGSVNQSDYLRDTENRRYWPVSCGTIHRDRLTSARDHLWAEAVVLYHQHEPWWVDPGLRYVVEAQEERQSADAWTDTVCEFVRGRTQVTMREILQDGLGLDTSRQDRSAETRIGNIIKRLQWTRKKISFKNERHYVYFPPEIT